MAQQGARKALRSRGGLKITLNDDSGQESFTIETPGGQKFLLKNGPGQVEINDGNGNTVKLGTGGITINAVAKITLNASHLEINSSMITVNAGMANFSGVVKCDTLVSNSVISANYTPGAGNVW
jgi:hypothetical protein